MDKSRYTKVYTHKRIDILTLAVANPSEGDKLGYVVDDERFEGRMFNLLSEALDAIDEGNK